MAAGFERAVLATWRLGVKIENAVMTENAIAKDIVDAAFRIHTTLGPGLLESVYDTVLAYDLDRRGLRTVRQQPIPVIYENVRIDTGFRAGLIVEYAPDGTLLTITGSYTGVDIPKDGASCSAEKMGRRFSSPAERRSIVGA